ncbi:MAG: SpoIIE family protein phosphatase [Phycisphaerae bacterium]
MPSLDTAPELQRDLDVVETEFEIACQIQSAYVPDRCFGWPGTRVIARTHSTAHLGGDFHHSIQARNGVVSLVVGRVEGRGYPAAMAKALLSGAVRTFAREAVGVRSIVNRLNHILMQINEDLRGAPVTGSLACALVDHASRSVSLATAGECDILLGARSANVIPVREVNPKLGLSAAFDCRTETLDLELLRRGLFCSTAIDSESPSFVRAWHDPLEEQVNLLMTQARDRAADLTVLAAELGDQIAGGARLAMPLDAFQTMDAADPSVYLG